MSGNIRSNFSPESNVFDPPQVAALAMRKADDIGKAEDADRLYTGLPLGFDDYFVMWRRQKVIGVLGDTSNYKTGLMTFIAREAAKHLDANKGEIGIYATWEDPVEDYALADIANASFVSMASIYNGSVTPDERNEMLKASIKRAAFPLWLFGHSEYQNARRPRLTMTDIAQALAYIVDEQGKTVKFIVLDYLQRISHADINTRGDTRGGFVEIVNRVKDMAHAFNCGVMLGSQVTREIRERKDKQPQVHDAQETSNFEQTMDGIISVQMPCKTMASREVFAHTQDGEVLVTNRLLSVEVLKQKKGATGRRFLYDALYEINGVTRYTGND